MSPDSSNCAKVERDRLMAHELRGVVGGDGEEPFLSADTRTRSFAHKALATMSAALTT